jgi:hypothetical protein
MWGFAVFCVLMVGLILFVYYICVSSRNTKFEVTTSGLKITDNIYGRTIPFEILRLEEARPINLNSQPEYRLRFGTSSSTMPGYRSGWYRSTQGKMLAFITDPTRVLYIPTQKAYGIMLSVDNSEALLAALKRMAADQRR